MRRLAAFAGAFLLTACVATPTLVPAGDYQSGGVTVTLERSWTEMPEIASTGAPYLTFDGPLLNQVHVLSAIPAGEGIIKTQDEDATVPTFRAGMSAIELVELVTDSVGMLLDLEDVAPADVKPATLAGAEGVSFVFTAARPTGLRYRGAATAAESNGTLDVMLFIAPEAHYYGALAPEVERLFASARR
jgi:hypothetical protein